VSQHEKRFLKNAEKNAQQLHKYPLVLSDSYSGKEIHTTLCSSNDVLSLVTARVWPLPQRHLLQVNPEADLTFSMNDHSWFWWQRFSWAYYQQGMTPALFLASMTNTSSDQYKTLFSGHTKWRTICLSFGWW